MSQIVIDPDDIRDPTDPIAGLAQHRAGRLRRWLRRQLATLCDWLDREAVWGLREQLERRDQEMARAKAKWALEQAELENRAEAAELESNTWNRMLQRIHAKIDSDTAAHLAALGRHRPPTTSD